MCVITQHCYSVRQLYTIVMEPQNAVAMQAAHYAAALHKLSQLTEQQQQQQQQQQAPSGLSPARKRRGGAPARGAEAEAAAVVPAPQPGAPPAGQRQQAARLAGQLLSGFQERMHEAAPRDLADAASAAAKLQVVPRRAWARAYRSAVSSHLERGPRGFGARELVRVLWAAAKLHQHEQRREAAARRPQQHLHRRGAWADDDFSGGGGGAPAAALAPAWGPRAAWLGELSASLLPRLASLHPQGLSTAAWAFAALGFDPGAAWWSAFLWAAGPQLRQGRFGPQMLSNTAWALAKLGVDCGARAVPGNNGSSSSSGGGGSGTASGGGDGTWWPAFLEVSEPLLTYGAFSPQGMSNIIWAAATAGVQPPGAWLGSFMAAAQADMGGFSAQQLSNMLWALGAIARQQQREQQRDQERQGERGRQERGGGGSGDGEDEEEEEAWRQRARRRREPLGPSPEWMERLWGQLARVEAELEPQGLSSILWALVALGIRPMGRWGAFLESEVGVLAPVSAPQALSVYAWSLPRIGRRPRKRWFSQFVRATLPPMRAAVAARRRRQQQQQHWEGSERLGGGICDPWIAAEGAAAPVAGDAAGPGPGSEALAAAAAGAPGAHGRGAFAPQGLLMLVWGFDRMRRHAPLPEACREALVWCTLEALDAAAEAAEADEAAAAGVEASAVAGSAGSSAADGGGAISGFFPQERRRAAPGAFSAAELPSLLYFMVRIKAAPPAVWLRQYQAALIPHAPRASPRLLSQLLFSLARARAPPGAALLAACVGRLRALGGGSFSAGDSAMHLWALGALACQSGHGAPGMGPHEAPPGAPGQAAAAAADAGVGGGAQLWGGLTAAWLDEHLAGMEAVLPQMDHKQLAMVIWGLAQLGHRPTPAWMASFLAAAQNLLGPHPPPALASASHDADDDAAAPPAAAPRGAAAPRRGIAGAGAGAGTSLLSVATLLSSLRALDFLPPSGFMAAAHSAAAAAIWDDPTPSLAQRELLSERVNEAVAWYKQRVQQIVGAGGGGRGGAGASCDEQQQQQQQQPGPPASLGDPAVVAAPGAAVAAAASTAAAGPAAAAPGAAAGA